MGIKAFTSQSFDEVAKPVTKEVDLPASGVVDTGAWYKLENVRLKRRGYATVLEPREGLQSRYSYSDSVVHSYEVQAVVDQVLTYFLVVLLDTGSVCLYNPTINQNYVLFTTTANRLNVAGIGEWIYIFCEGDAHKVVFAKDRTVYDWNAGRSAPVLDAVWRVTGVDGETRSFANESIWDFRVGKSVVNFPMFFGTGLPNKVQKLTLSKVSGNELYYINDESATKDEVKLNNAYPYSSLLQDYIDVPLADQVTRTAVGGIGVTKQLLNGPFTFDFSIGAVNATPLNFTDSDSIWMIADAIANEINTNPAFSNWDATVQQVWTGGISPLDPITTFPYVRIVRNEVNVDEGIVIAFTVNAANLTAYATSPTYYESTYLSETDFPIPTLTRAYQVVELLKDGSYRLSGRPKSITASPFDLVNEGYVGVKVSLKAQDNAQVAKRLLFCTRFLIGDRACHTPSTPDFENSAFYLLTELKANATEYVDYTPDDQLYESMSTVIDLVAGVSNQFGPNEVTPKTVSRYKGALLLGNLTVNRMIPDIYHDLGSDTGNVFVEKQGTTDTNYAIAVRFGYVDGSFSRIVYDAIKLKDEVNHVQIHSLNALIRSVDLFINNPAEVSGGASSTYSIQFLNWNYNDSTVIITVDGVNVNVSSGLGTGTFDGSETASLFASQIDVALTTHTCVAVGDTITITRNEKNDVPITVSVDSAFDNEVTATLGVASTVGSNPLPIIYKVGSYTIDQAECHGLAIEVPISLSGLVQFVIPEDEEVKETAYLPDFMALGLPAQQVLISSQVRGFQQSAIQRIVPMKLDVERGSVLRYTILLLTDRDVQVGYLVNEGATFTGQFEIADSSIQALSPDVVLFYDNRVYFQTDNGIAIFIPGQGIQAFASRSRFPELTSAIRGILYHEKEREVWFLCDDGLTVLVYDVDLQGFKTFVFTPGDGVFLRGIHANNRGLYVSYTVGIGKLSDTLNYDRQVSNYINCLIESLPLGATNEAIRILSAKIYAETGTASLQIDEGRSRMIDGPAWTSDFVAHWEKAFAEGSIRMNGFDFPVFRRGITPRIQFSWLAGNPLIPQDYFFERIRLNVSPILFTAKAQEV